VYPEPSDAMDIDTSDTSDTEDTTSEAYGIDTDAESDTDSAVYNVGDCLDATARR
jgi:hypothetical protein